MAINIPILTEFADNGIRAAKKAFENFQTSVADAQGTMGKFKAGSGAVLDAVKANAATFAVAGAAAFAKFAASSVNAFQDLGLAVDKFSIASGLRAEDASRWVEVAGDLGVSVESVQTAIGRMNRTVGEKPELFRDLGVDLVYANDGALDVNATFINTLQHLKDIQDPAERAKEGVKLLGKGWADMALLIDQGAVNLNKSLTSVSEAKIIDQNEIGKARNFRDATDELRGKFEDLALTLGEELVPQITAIVRTLAPAIEYPVKFVGGFVGLDTVTELSLKFHESLVDVVKELGAAQVMADTGMTALELLATIGTTAGDSMLYLADESRKYTEYSSSRIEAIEGTTRSLEEQTDEIDATDAAWKRLKGTLEIESSMISARDQLDKLKETAIEAYQGADGALAEYEQGLIDAKLMVLNLAENINLSNSQQNYLRVLVDTGELEKALTMLDLVKAGGYTDATNAMRFRGGRAAGGPVEMGSTYLVGERGPELFTPTGSGNITPNGAFGGNNITVNVTSANPDDVVAAIKKWSRDNGAVPIRTTMTRTG